VREEVYVPTGAWLLIGIGCALVIGTLLVLLIFPSDRRRPARFSPPRFTMPRLTIPANSPVGSLLKGFSYLYAPLSNPHVRRNVAGRLRDAIARIDAIDPSAAPERVGQALQQMVDLVGPDELQPEVGSEPPVNIFDQPRREEQA